MGSSYTDTRREIDKQVSFLLYSVANRMVRGHKPFLEPLGLTFPQYLVMLDLLDAAPQTVNNLGARVAMDTGTITPLLKRLEKSGLITRRRDTEDERRVMVDLTPQGRALRDPIRAVSDQIMVACEITDERAIAIRQMLEEMGGSSKP